MVDLALLCNLYADGPTTLGRLRELGCESLADVERIERADLEWALQAGSESCERFRREARALRERTGSAQSAPQRTPPVRAGEETRPAGKAHEHANGARGSEAAPIARATSEHMAAAAANDESHQPSAAEPTRAALELTPEAARPAGSPSILGVLLQAWRRASGRGGDAPARPRHESNERRVPAPREVHEGRSERPAGVAASEALLTGRALPTQPAPSAASSSPAPAEPTSTPAASASPVPTVELTPQEPKPAIRSSAAPLAERRPEHGTPLERIGFQGVEADYAEQLARLGVRTVEDFLATQPLDLAGRSTMRYTVLLRMQFLARRELERVVRG
jgi:hypothetical protein